MPTTSRAGAPAPNQHHPEPHTHLRHSPTRLNREVRALRTAHSVPGETTATAQEVSHAWGSLRVALQQRSEAAATSGTEFGFTPVKRLALRTISSGLAITGVPAAFFPALLPFTVGALGVGAAGLAFDKLILDPAGERAQDQHRERLLQDMVAQSGTAFNRAAAVTLSDQDWSDLHADPTKLIAIGEKVVAVAPYVRDIVDAESEGWGRSDLLRATRRRWSVRKGRLMNLLGLSYTRVEDPDWRMSRARVSRELGRCAQLDRRARVGGLPRPLQRAYDTLTGKTAPRPEDWAQYLTDTEHARFGDELATAVARRRAEVLIAFCNHLKAHANHVQP